MELLATARFFDFDLPRSLPRDRTSDEAPPRVITESQNCEKMARMSMWTFRNLSNPSYQPTMHLELYWEAHGDPISDDYLQEEIEPGELWRKWRRKYVPDDGWVDVWWFVQGTAADDIDGVFSGAPGAPWGGQDTGITAKAMQEHSFLNEFTWPEHAETGESLNFLTLPVADKLWRPGRADKGGFIQEHLGWKPAAFQARFHVPTLEAVRR